MDNGAKKNRLQKDRSSLSKDAERVYWQLRKVSPQCPSSISAESGLSVVKTINALNELWLSGIAESISNPNEPSQLVDEYTPESPWRVRYHGKKVRTKRLQINSQQAVCDA